MTHLDDETDEARLAFRLLSLLNADNRGICLMILCLSVVDSMCLVSVRAGSVGRSSW
jgi:hypothetical protein